MELKRIIARDSRAANEKAIQLYGPDVLIISSQRVDSQTELVVAIDVAPLTPAELAAENREEQANAEAVAAKARPQAHSFVPFSQIFEGEQGTAVPADEGDVTDDTTALAEPAAVVLQKARTAAPATVPETAPVVAQPVVQAVAEPVAVASHEMQRSHEIVELLRQEMSALRKEFALSRKMMSWQDSLDLAPEIQQLSAALMDAGMPAGLHTLVTDSIRDLETAREALPVVQDLLAGALARAETAWPQTGVHALCGPSGSGKTSMVARLACAAAQTHGADQQVMISFTDQRPGAWAQMQLLAAQAGVTCYRAADSAMLKALLDDLAGKTIWIDTSGTDFAAQAEVLRQKHPEVLVHAVLPVDATVTNVQKILQNSNSLWATLMLSKIDEAAMPWALIKGLSDHALPVSCVAGHSRIGQAPQAFDPVSLVTLALEPVHRTLNLAAQMQAPVTQAVSAAVAPMTPMARVRKSPAAPATSAATFPATQKAPRSSKPRQSASTAAATSAATATARTQSLPIRSSPDILVAATQAASRTPSRAKSGASLKVVHG